MKNFLICTVIVALRVTLLCSAFLVSLTVLPVRTESR